MRQYALAKNQKLAVRFEKGGELQRKGEAQEARIEFISWWTRGGTYTREIKVLDISVRYWTWYTRKSSSPKISKGERGSLHTPC